MSETKKAVVVCTDKRGVFFGYADDTEGDVITLEQARMSRGDRPRAGKPYRTRCALDSVARDRSSLIDTSTRVAWMD